MAGELNQAVIAIGSNIDPGRNVAQPISRIGQSHRLIAKSKFAWTTPIGNANQDDFLNGAVLIQTPMPQNDLKTYLLELESQLGRHRSADKFGPRTIDLDLVVWNGQVVHKDVSERDFVRQAVLEICPEIQTDRDFTGPVQ